MLGFRVWDSKEKIMYKEEPDNLSFTLWPNGDFEVDCFENRISYDDGKRFIPMQSTGIEDDSGKLIYEGDFLTVFLRERDSSDKPKIERNHQSYLVEDVKTFLMKVPRFYWPLTTVMKIIGNKYQNSNLLEDLK